jgi:hypothetical protein
VSAARVFVAFLVARAAFGLAFLAVSLGRLPVLLYYPIERRFVWSAPGAAPPGLAMAWFGATALALAAAALGGAIAWVGCGRGPLARALVRPQVVLGIARAGGLILLVDFAYFGWSMTHQTPAPLPLPGWYSPR